MLCREVEVKATRRPHRCFGCRGQIPVGSPAQYFVCAEDGDFSSGHLCGECLAVYDDFVDGVDGDDWYEGGEYRREIEKGEL